AKPLPGLLALALHQHFAALAGRGLVEGDLVSIECGLKALQPFVHDFARELTLHRRCRGAGAGRILEAERLSVSNLIDQLESFLERRVCFPGEADDEIAADRDVGAGGTETLDQPQIAVGGMAAVHSLENSVAATLH